VTPEQAVDKVYAATAAGMENAARNIAKRIKALEKELDEKL